jgi:hypothetical protein
MVIEGTRNNYFEPIVRSDNWLRAVDMESAGVALAVRSLRERGQAVGLMIVRGISDVPASVSGDAPNRNTRWQWTDYASKAAAVFLQQFITRAFPTAPRGQPTVAAGRVRRQLDPFVFAAYRSRFARANDLPAVHTMNNNLFDPEDLVPATTLEAWWRRNPLTIRIVSSPKGDAVGYWHILPFTEEAFRKMSEGRQKERDIGDGEIAAYSDLRPGSVYLYITAVAALDQASSSPVVLDMIAFITLVEELIGVDGIAAMSVSDDPLNLIASFVMARVESTDPQVWLLNSRGEVKRALATGRAHLDELKGLVPETPRSEDQTLRQLLAART